MKKLLLSFPLLLCMLLLGGRAMAEDITTTFVGNPAGKAWAAGQVLNCEEGGLEWVTSGKPNSFDASNNRGVQFSKTSSDITTTVTGNVTKVTVVASSNTAENSIAVSVGGTAFGSTKSINKTNNETYVFNTSVACTGEVKVSLISSGETGKSIYIKSITLTYDGEIGGGGDEPEPPVDPVQPSDDDFFAALNDAMGAWSFEDVNLPEGATYIWKQDNNYGMVASANFSGANHVAESYLVSPLLQVNSNSVLTFEHANKYNDGNYDQSETVWVREENGQWSTQLTVPNYSDGSSWDFVASGDISLSAFAGKKIQIGWRYTSTEAAASKWEVKNVKVTNAKTAQATPEIMDPSNTEETAYTVAEVIAIISNGNYDLSKDVYVKGKIVKVDSFNENYGSITYWISEDGSESATQFEVYGGLNFKGSKFESIEALKAGDDVIVKGKVKKYGDVYEFDKNNELVKLNGNGAGEEEIVLEPTASLKAGSYLVPSELTVSLTTKTENARVLYCIDGDDATQNECTGTITIPEGTHTVKAVAQSVTGTYGKIVSFEYNVVAESSLTTEISNGDLEAWTNGTPDGWASVSTASSAKLEETTGRSGKGALVKGEKGKNTRLGSREMKVQPGYYTLTAYAKDITVGSTPAMACVGYVPLELKDGAANYTVGTYVYPKDDKGTAYSVLNEDEWTKMSFTFKVEAEQIISVVVMNHYANKEEVFDIAVDDIEFRQATDEEIEALGVSGVQADVKDAAIYDLSGRQINKAVKGIYIQNGKKVLK